MINPFNQNISNWQFSITCLKSDQYQIIEVVDEWAESYTIFEIDELTSLITVFASTTILAEQFIEKLNNIYPNLNISQIIKVEDKDWVTETQINFKPIDISNFYIHSSYYKPLNEIINKITIEIDPGRAFGTGEHETTKLCLSAISELDLKESSIVLDLGCGSAVLAIAVKKKFNCNVIASDIDDIAVIVAKNNCAINNVPDIETVISDGFSNKKLNIKFNLIVANILANPLIEMSSDISEHITLGGYAIISGFTNLQQQEVLNSYLEKGFNCIKSFEQNNWVSVLIQRS